MNIVEYLFPPYCISCQKLTRSQHNFYKYICPLCLKKIEINYDNFCYLCNTPTLYGNTCEKCKKKTSLSGLIVGSDYDNPILKETIHYFKYRYIKTLALSLSWILMTKLKNSSLLKNANDWLIVPVPLAKKRLKYRGFNQAELLAINLSKWLGIPLSSVIIKRTKFRAPQMQIQNQKQRKKNIEGCFSVNYDLDLAFLKNKRIMLVDDVATTGATLNECAKVLKPYVKEIWGCVVAK
jgi:ComF family protein